MKRNEIIRKLEFYQLDKKLIHVSCTNKRFYNGTVMEINSEKEYLILRDIKLGEVPIMFEEVFDIEPYINEVGK